MENVPGASSVVNAQWRDLDKAVRKGRQTERKLQADLARQTAREGSEIQKKAGIVETLQAVQTELARLCAERKATPKKVTIDSLPEDQRPTQRPPLNKMLSDTVKMIAYRAETALVALLRRHLKKEEEARELVRELFVTAADIEPNDDANTLTIRIHRMAAPVHDNAIMALLEDLTKLGFRHPETGAKIIYALV